MRKKLALLIVILFPTFFYGQIVFEKGYFINNANQRIDCFIKNIDWKNNPKKFEYKFNETEPSKKANIKTVKEFGIHNVSKYIRRNVSIDRSSETLNEISKYRNPIFKNEELFLKVLVEGKANLYLYREENLVRFFYNTEDFKTTIKQLVFKSYLISRNSIGKNNLFKQQLWNDLKCPNFSIHKTENIRYAKSELIAFFVEYNLCHNNDYKNFEEKQKRDLFNLNIRSGINSSSLSINNSLTNTTVDFDNEFALRFGIEAELISGFNKNKWSIIIEPTYQYFNSKKTVESQNFDVSYSSIEIPIGLRYYSFLNQKSKLFFNGSYVLDIPFDSKIRNLQIETRNNIALGIGYKYSDRYSVEIRYLTDREILSNYVFWKSDYQTLSFIIGYTLF